MSISASEWLKWAIVFGLGPGPTPGGATISEVLAAEGFTVLSPARVGTVANLTATYSNGASGVGATLTNSGTQAALVINGITLAVGNRVLVKNQSSALQNGVYTVTNIGSGSTNWVMTRATDFNQTSNIIQYTVIYVSAGTVDFQKYYDLASPTPLVVGTDAITFEILNFFNIFVPSPILYQKVVAVTKQMVPNYSYLAVGDGVDGVAFTFPATAVEGSTLEIIGGGLQPWSAVLNAGQTCRIANSTSSTGGSISASSPYDNVILRCVVANTDWVMSGAPLSGDGIDVDAI